MSVQLILRAIAGVVAVILLLTLGFTSISGGISQLPHWNTFETRLQSAAQILSGLSALLIIVTQFRWRGVQRAIAITFVLTSVLSAGLSPIAWFGATVTRGLVAAAAALGIAVVILWMFRFGAGFLPMIKSAEH
ncbi:MAG TPA: hypothetical protein VFZ73_04215 [Gemmatimonadaceae bacterium]